MEDRCREVERSIIKQYRKEIWRPFVRASNDYDMIRPGNSIAVCTSGGKDSMLLAKCMQEILRYEKMEFGLHFIVMDPGHHPDNRRMIEDNARLMGILVQIFGSDIFNIVVDVDESLCYLCARIRQGYLYAKAKELGCNKIASGHHFDDVIETILMSMLYGAQVNATMPKLHSTNFEGMELIHPLYLVREEHILARKDHNDLKFLQCAYRFIEQIAGERAIKGQNPADIVHTSKHQEMKESMKQFRKVSLNIEMNIFRSVENVSMDACIGHVKSGKRHHLLEEYQHSRRSTHINFLKVYRKTGRCFLMMELVKKNIHMNRWKGNASTQTTLDDDFIMSDIMDGMAQVILDTGDVVVESVESQGERVQVKGEFNFQVLYQKVEGGLQALGGSIPFDEMINVPDLDEKNYVGLSWELKDLNAGIINSGKLSMKAVMMLEVRAETLYDVEAASDIDTGETDVADNVNVEFMKRDVDVVVIACRRRDTYRIKEDIPLSGNKPNIDRVLWDGMCLRGANTRPMDGQIHADGELTVFIIYPGEGEEMPMQWLEESIPFSGEVELPKAVEETISAINARLVRKDLEAKPDYDGEMRDLEVDAVLELDIKLYEGQNMELLSDVYSINRELVLQIGEVYFDKLLTHNVGKCKVSEKVNIKNTECILQICHNEGNIKIDKVEVKDDGLHIDSALEVKLLYLTANDVEPVHSSTGVVPFRYMVEAPDINEGSVYQMNTGLEQMTAVMMGSDTIEIKAVITLDIPALQPVYEPVTINVNVGSTDMQEPQELPGIVGYIMQSGDSLWKIAKKFHITVDNIMVANGLTDSNIHPGERLILVKEIAR